MLKKNGYHASSLRGGIGRWKTSGFALVQVVGKEKELLGNLFCVLLLNHDLLVLESHPWKA